MARSYWNSRTARLLVVLACVVTLLPASVAAGGATEQAAKTEQKELRVAVQSFYVSSVMGHITAKGWDKQEGLNLKLIMFGGGAPINEAMAAGLWDAAVTGGAFIFAMANYKANLIGHHIDGTGNNSVFVRKDSPVLSVKGFNPKYPAVYGDPKSVIGKVLLQNTGTTSQYTAVTWLETLGIKEEQVKTVSLDFAQIYQSFLIGQGDIAAITGPHASMASQNKDWVEAASLKSAGGGLYEALICTDDAYKSRKADLVKLVRLIYRANDELEANPELKFQTVMKWYKDAGKEIAEKDVRAECTGKPFITSAEARKIPLGEFAKKYAEFYVKVKKLEPAQVKTVEDSVRNDVLQEALAGIK